MTIPAAKVKETAFRLASSMRLGPPTLRVRDLDAMLGFYQNDIGLDASRRREGEDGLSQVELRLGKEEDPLLVLKHDPAAAAPSPDFAGLYHYAVLLPGRKDLASTFLAVGNTGVPYEGYADHTFSEAIYLHDPEMNGMEFYADRPRSLWPKWDELSGKAGGYRRFASLNGPLDLRSLVGELSASERSAPVAFPRGARIGHMHLRVTDLDRSVEFYRSVLGFDVTMYFPEIGAAFLSVGGYHHHLGLNTWHSRGGTPHKQGDAGLEGFKVLLPGARDLEQVSRRLPGSSVVERRLTVTDPDGIPITLQY